MYFPEWLYTIDILFLLFVFGVVFIGIKQGLSGELAHVVSMIVLLAGVWFFYPQLTQFISSLMPDWSSLAVTVGAWGLLLLATGLSYGLARLTVTRFVKGRLGEPADKFFGSFAGALRGVLLGLILLAGLSIIPDESLYQKLSEKSLAGAWVCKTVTPWTQSYKSKLEALKTKVNEDMERKADQDQMNDSGL